MKITPRGFTKAIKEVLGAHNIQGEVKSKTEGFSGFGFGDACTATVRVESKLPDAVMAKLAGVEATFRAGPGGPVFSEKQQSAFMIHLAGSPYPFGGRVSSKR